MINSQQKLHSMLLDPQLLTLQGIRIIMDELQILWMTRELLFNLSYSEFIS